MEYSEVKTSIVPSPNSTLVPNPFSSSSPSCSSPPPPPTLPHSPPPPMVVMSPCAACKILRRRCAEKCVLAPYFPPTEPLKFTTAHRVFGASNIIKLLQELPESQRADAVSSMVYEANARVRDPIYGCAGAICHLQKQISELQAQLAKTQADLLNMQCQQEYLLGLLDAEMGEDGQNQFQISPLPLPQPCEDSIFFSDVDAGISMGAWKPLWT